MIVYSKKIVQFIDEIKYIIKNILKYEVRLKVTGDRFLDRQQESSYPIKVVIYNNKTLWGYFEPQFYELGFHESLMHMERNQLLDIVRHELAHYITFINYGAAVLPHGAEFRAFCDRMGWGEEVYKATACLEGEANGALKEESSVLRKVQKLMALASSSNKNEAEQAMIKSQQLLLKHHVEAKYLGGEEEEKIFLKRVMKQKKENAKMRSIAAVLQTFFVSTVFRRTHDFTYLEILGNAENIEIAEHVAAVLEKEWEKLWSEAQKYAQLKGMVAKNSFFLGLARGYCDKIEALKKEYNSETSNALMVIEKKLVEGRAMAYSRLSSSKSSGQYCERSSALGEHMGRQLNINPAIPSSAPSEVLLLD